MTHKILNAYLRMALGLPWDKYTVEMCLEDYNATLDKKPVAMVDYVWTGQDVVNQICMAKNITRERFIKSMAAPKPSEIANWIFCDELQKAFGEFEAPGFTNQRIHWPNQRGLIAPIRENGEIIELRFYPLSKILKAKRQYAEVKTSTKNW